jgi:hypothetical protein
VLLESPHGAIPSELRHSPTAVAVIKDAVLYAKSRAVIHTHGLLREPLSSLYSLFGIVREVLRRYGTEVAEPKRDGNYNPGYLAVMVNYNLSSRVG